MSLMGLELPEFLRPLVVVAIGLILAFPIGGWMARIVLEGMRGELDAEGQKRAKWAGHAERGFFGFWTGVSVSTALPGMLTWAGMKLAANWGSRKSDVKDVRIGRVSALAGALASLTFAAVAGLVIRAGLQAMGIF